jgi:hypothetical protein
MMENCDKCGSKIVQQGEGRFCACGEWLHESECPPTVNAFEHAILVFNELARQWGNDAPISADHWTGTCMIMFKGDAKDCEHLKHIIKLMRENKK